MKMKKAAPRQVANQAADIIVLCFMMRGGTVAFSPFQIWMLTQTLARTPNRTKRAMTRGFDHGYFVPPHWRARRTQMIAGRKTAVPIGSMESSFCFVVNWAVDLRFGDLKKTAMIKMVIAPMGKLM